MFLFSINNHHWYLKWPSYPQSRKTLPGWSGKDGRQFQQTGYRLAYSWSNTALQHRNFLKVR